MLCVRVSCVCVCVSCLCFNNSRRAVFVCEAASLGCYIYRWLGEFSTSNLGGGGAYVCVSAAASELRITACVCVML